MSLSSCFNNRPEILFSCVSCGRDCCTGVTRVSASSIYWLADDASRCGEGKNRSKMRRAWREEGGWAQGGGQSKRGEVDLRGRGERVCFVIIMSIIHTFVVRSSRRFCCNMRTSGSLRVTTGPHRTSDSPLSGTPSAPASPSGNLVASSGRSTHTGVGCCVRDQYPKSGLRRGT